MGRSISTAYFLFLIISFFAMPGRSQGTDELTSLPQVACHVALDEAVAEPDHLVANERVSEIPPLDSFNKRTGLLTPLKGPLTVDGLLKGYHDGYFAWRNNEGIVGLFVGEPWHIPDEIRDADSLRRVIARAPLIFAELDSLQSGYPQYGAQVGRVKTELNSFFQKYGADLANSEIKLQTEGFKKINGELHDIRGPVMRGILDFRPRAGSQYGDLHIPVGVTELERKINKFQEKRAEANKLQQAIVKANEDLNKLPDEIAKRRSSLNKTIKNLTDARAKAIKVMEDGVPYQILTEQDGPEIFEKVLYACAYAYRDNERHWLEDKDLQNIYLELNRRGFGRAVAIYDVDGTLVGGTFGFFIDGVYYGESMFVKRNEDGTPMKNSFNKTIAHTGQLALVKMVERLQAAGILWLDSQAVTATTGPLGAKFEPLEYFRNLMDLAHENPKNFPAIPKATLAF